MKVYYREFFRWIFGILGIPTLWTIPRRFWNTFPGFFYAYEQSKAFPTSIHVDLMLFSRFVYADSW